MSRTLYYKAARANRRMRIALNRRMRTGMGVGLRTGLVSGILSVPVMVVFTLLYESLTLGGGGSTGVVGLLVPGAGSILVGAILGAILGGWAARNGFEFVGLRQGTRFGIVVMAVAGGLIVLLDIIGGPARFANSFVLRIGVDLLCPVIGGLLGGAFVGAVNKLD